MGKDLQLSANLVGGNHIGEGKIPSLDGLRGISFLIVFVAHAGLDRIVPGRLGVNIFFILSGYLITTLMIREYEETGTVSLKNFYLRRTVRILPPMYAILAGTLLYLFVVHHLHGITLAAVCSQAFYYQNYYFHAGQGLIPGLGVLWSLAVEEHFYLIFPWLFVFLLIRRKLGFEQCALWILGLCALVLVWRCYVVFHFSNGLVWARDTTDCRADSILFGCALAFLERSPRSNDLFHLRRLQTILLPGSVVILLVTLLLRNPIFRETLRYTLQGLALMPALYYVVHFPRSGAGRVLNLRWLTWLGTLSYGLYLLHYTILLEVQRWLHSSILCGVVSLGVAVLPAYVVHVFVERPTNVWRQKYRSRAHQKTPLHLHQRARLSVAPLSRAE